MAVEADRQDGDQSDHGGDLLRELLAGEPEAQNGSMDNATRIDLIGGPFAVIESDPGVFTSLIRKLGVQGIEVEEIYDIQSTLNQLKPKGLILCFVWSHDKHHPNDFLDPAAKNVWFANQVIDDACATQAIVNVLFNCPEVNLGKNLSDFKAETSEMSPMMKGLAISNLHTLREAQNSLARPVDRWGALSAVAGSTQDAAKEAAKPARKRKRTENSTRKTGTSKNKKTVPEDEVETFHFIGYVPAFGKVWELDGLKSGPLEVGELPGGSETSSTIGWEDVVRPALRLKMEKYGAAEDGCIQFNLLALVEDRYQLKSDELELLKRRRKGLERRLVEDCGEDWRELVSSEIEPDAAFSTSVQDASPGPSFAQDFGLLKMESDKRILELSPSELLDAWSSCVTNALPVKLAVEEEIQKAAQARADSIKRTHDYEPFIRDFISALHNEGKLAGFLPKSGSKAKANGEKAEGT